MTAFIPARSTAQWQSLDRDHHLHPFTDNAALYRKGTRIISHAHGIYLYDTDGHRLLDAMAGLWCVGLGYGRETLVEVARQQMLELPFYNSFFQTAHRPAIELARLLVEVSPEQFKHVFFTGSGSESADTVIRLVRRHWEIKGQPQRSVLISRKNAYHGSTLGGASLSGMSWIHQQGGLPIPGIEHIQQPYWFGEGGSAPPAEFGLRAADALEEAILRIGPEKVAAFIAEPVQGAGGVIIPPSTYWPRIQQIVDRYGILLVADEVICGFGRTGRWFGSDLYGIRPDLMTVAKGISSGYLPIGAVLLSKSVAAPLLEAGEFHHGFTYSGHPVCCAVACATINIMRDEKVVEHVANVAAPYLSKRWAALAEHPLIGEARSVGLMGALELVRDKQTRARFEREGAAGTLCRDICFENGLIMRAVKDTLVIAPPLVITTAEIDELVDTARRCLDQTWERLRKRALT
jgi:putrescine aminotransferase